MLLTKLSPFVCEIEIIQTVPLGFCARHDTVDQLNGLISEFLVVAQAYFRMWHEGFFYNVTLLELGFKFHKSKKQGIYC